MIKTKRFNIEDRKKIYNLFENTGGNQTSLYGNWYRMNKKGEKSIIYIDKTPGYGGGVRACERYFHENGILIKIEKKEDLPISIIERKGTTERKTIISSIERIMGIKLIGEKI